MSIKKKEEKKRKKGKKREQNRSQILQYLEVWQSRIIHEKDHEVDANKKPKGK